MNGSILTKGNNVFEFHYSQDGKRFRKSICAKNMSDASVKYKKFLEQLNKEKGKQ